MARVYLERLLLGTMLLLLLPPLGIGALAGLAWWSVVRGSSPRQAWWRALLDVGMVAGTLPWLVLGMWPVNLPPDASRWQLQPFADITRLLTGPPGEALVQIVGNLLVFFVPGLLAPVRFAAAASWTRLFMLGAAASLVLEVGQHLFAIGRVFSIDDILLNAVGAVLGGLVSRRWWGRLASGAQRSAGVARR